MKPQAVDFAAFEAHPPPPRIGEFRTESLRNAAQTRKAGIATLTPALNSYRKMLIMASKKLFAVALLSAAFLSGCYADASSPDAGAPVGGPTMDWRKSDAPVPPSAAPDPASAARPGGNAEVVDLSLG
jgi:hypothetical protein